MDWDASIRRYNPVKLLPLYSGANYRERHVNLAPNTYFARGRVLGQVTNSANDVQTLTMGAGPTGGFARVRIAHPMSGAFATFDLPYNATNAVAQGLIQARVGSGNYTVTGGAWPGTPLVFTAAGQFVGMPVLLFTVESFLTGPGAPYTPTVAKTTNGRSQGTAAPYAAANADGSQVARAVMPWECATDSAGNITLGPKAQEGYRGEVFPSVPVYIGGLTLDTKELVGLDQAAVDSLGRISWGTLADGELELIG
jgi:hypothetical protein